VFRIQGQLARADREERAESEINARVGSPTQAFNPILEAATSEVLLHDRAEAALRTVDSAVAKFPMSTLDPVDRPYLPLADFYVRAGQVEKAERLLEEYERTVPEALKNADFAPIQTRALIALGKGQYADALKGFREYRDKNGGELTSLPEIAQAFDRMGQTDSAVATYESYTAATGLGPSGREYNLPRAFRRLGELYEGKDKAKALEYYGKFVGIWKDADPDLQPRVQEVKQRMAALAGEPKRP
jgi:tetratricopeptide (TPR) repeat protein